MKATKNIIDRLGAFNSTDTNGHIFRQGLRTFVTSVGIYYLFFRTQLTQLVLN